MIHARMAYLSVIRPVVCRL